MILLIGGNGAIGKRYQAILRHLEKRYEVLDIDAPNQKSVLNLCLTGMTHVIIATPTPTHLGYIEALRETGIPFLIEKPLSKDCGALRWMDLKGLEKGFVVNNYAFITDTHLTSSIEYDFFNTGKDGLIWDVRQLVYIAYISKGDLQVKRDSFTWDCRFNGIEVEYKTVEYSYLIMIESFLNGDHQGLWFLKEGIKMSELLRRVNEESEVRL